MNRQIHINSLAKEIGAQPFRVLLGLGFDQRSSWVLNALVAAKPIEVIGLLNVGWDVFNSSGFHDFQSMERENARVVGVNCRSILELADAISMTVQSFDQKVKTIVDITSMSHELLAVLIAILRSESRLEHTILCYTGADRYSFNTSRDEMWLSRGVSSIRSVLGFGGEQLPSKKLHLVITVGFEVERAIEVIATYEPAVLSLGIGRREDSVSLAHHDANLSFFTRLESFVRDQENTCERVSQFEFSCIDPFVAKTDLSRHLERFREFNTVICPLNTKISTVGVALLCLEQPELQLCYAQPMEYNIDGYATASDVIRVIDV
jgi:hypothetical protein